MYIDTTKYSYKLGNSSSYGLDVAFEQPSIDEKNMSVRFPFADGNRRDGVGDLIEIGGIRTERHRINPLVLFDHAKVVTLPIGLAEDPETKVYTIELDPIERKAWATAFFYQGKGMATVERSKEYDHALFCEQLFDLVSKRYIRAGSVGYQTVKSMQIPPDYTSDHTPPIVGQHLIVTIMLEASIVVMPANSDTVLKCLSMPTICGKPMSPYLTKSLQAWAPSRRVQMGYEKKAAPDSFISSGGFVPHQGTSKKDASPGEYDKYPYGKIEDVPLTGNIPSRTKAAEGGGEGPGREAQGGRAEEELTEGQSYQRRQIRGPKEGRGEVPERGSAFRLPEPHRGFEGQRTHQGFTLKSLIPGEEPKAQRRQDAKFNKRRGLMRGCRHDPYMTCGQCLVDGLPGDTKRVKNRDYGGFASRRQKYRKLKGLIVRRKNSVPGVAIIRINDRDIDRVREICRTRNLKVTGSSAEGPGISKLRLQGDNGMLEQMAVEYGIKKGTKRMATKTLSGVSGTSWDRDSVDIKKGAIELLKQYLDTAFEGYRERAWDACLRLGMNLGNIPRTKDGAEKLLAELKKTGVKSMQYKVKDSPAPGGGPVKPEEGGMQTTEGPAEPEKATEMGEEKKLEPHGATLLRKVHEHHQILMEDYDEAVQVLENPSVKKFMVKLLEGIEETLTGVEDLFGHEYGEDLEGLQGTEEEGGMEDDEESEIPQAPTPEEAVEGMHPQEKRLIRAAQKILREQYSHKALGNGKSQPSDNISPEKARQILKDGEVRGHKITEDQRRMFGAAAGNKNFIGDENNEVETTMPKGKLDYHPNTDPLQQHTESAVPGGTHGSKDMTVGDSSHIPGKEAEDGSELTIHPYEAANWSNAKSFIKDLADAEEWNDEKRLDAYYYWKLLDPIQKRFEEHFKSYGYPIEESGCAYDEETHAGHPRDVGQTSAGPVKAEDRGQTEGGTPTASLPGQGEGKNFMGDEENEVEVTKPNGQLDYHPNKEPMQQHTESAVPGGTMGNKALGVFFKNLRNTTGYLKGIAASNYVDVAFKWMSDYKQSAMNLYKNFVSDEASEMEITKPKGKLDYHPNKEPMQQHTESAVPGGTMGSKSLKMEIDKQTMMVTDLVNKINRIASMSRQ